MIGLVANLVAIIAALLLLIVPLPFNTATRFYFDSPKEQMRDSFYIEELELEIRALPKALCAKLRPKHPDLCRNKEAIVEILAQPMRQKLPTDMRTIVLLNKRFKMINLDWNIYKSILLAAMQLKKGSFPIVSSYYLELLKSLMKVFKENEQQKKGVEKS